MEQLRARPALGREVNFLPPVIAGLVLWFSTAAVRGHGGEFILAKCSTGPDGRVSLVLTVDCAHHPVLKDRVVAMAAMREVLRVHTPNGPVALDSLAVAVPGFASAPDPDLPLPPNPGEESIPHILALLQYDWQPGAPEIQFSVPAGNPHDVLFWLAGAARPADGPVPWRILIAGDTSPPVPLPQPPSPTMPVAGRLTVAAAVGSALVGMIWWRRRRWSGREIPQET